MTNNLKPRTAFLAKISAFAAIIMMLFSGCTEEKYYINDHDYAAIDTYYYDGKNAIKPREWQLVDNKEDGIYYCATRALSAIDDYVMDGGLVLCYFIVNGYDNLLPYTRPRAVIGGYYSETIRYEIKNGIIRFIIEADDFELPADITEPLEFKVVVAQNFAP